MSKIKILSESVYSKIAAGEVIDRPSAVVRELIDNSIDAGASEIIIKTKSAGIDSIIVSDNGCGINKDDIYLSLTEHATSKIESINDLFSIFSMGFRGEALYSIQTVSHIKISSNTDNSGMTTGYQISNENSNIINVPFKKGTKIEVSDLFYNLPARKKFLKSKTIELNTIKKIITDKALSRTDISFVFFNDERLVFKTNGDNNFSNSFFNIFKNEIKFSIHHYSEDINQNISIKLYFSGADTFFPTRKNQILFVNNRPVTVPFFYSAIDSAIRDFISPGRHPLIFIFITINPSLIDINIHPAKKEIRFYDQNDIFDKLKYLIKKAFGQVVSREIILTDKIDNKQFLQDNKESMFDYNISDTTNKNYFNFLEQKENNNQEKQFLINENQDYKIVGRIFNNYILVEKDNKLLLIDQHAAAESIIYRKKLEKNISKQCSEKLIIPIVFDVDNWNEKIDKKIKILNNNGFYIEKGEGNSITIKELPSLLLNRKEYDFIVNIVTNFLENELNDDINILDQIIIEASCKEAIKKGDNLNLLEISEIVEQYFRMDIKNCPHGRPSHFEITLENLEKYFQRRK